MNKVYRFEDIAGFLHGADARVTGDTGSVEVSKISTLEAADRRSMVWVRERVEGAARAIESSSASLVIAHHSAAAEIAKAIGPGRCVVATGDPRLLFARIANALFVPRAAPGVHPTAVVHPEASISKSASIGPFTYIGASTIGDGSVIHGHCHVYDDVVIGRNCVVNAHCVIGASGSGYVKAPDGHWEPFPQIGRTILEDDVEIGANSYVARGALDETRIRRGTKIGLSACIGHNTQIGERAMILANAVVGGSTLVGNDAWVSVGAVIRNGINVGKNTQILMGAVVHKDVPDGVAVGGNPGRVIPRSAEIRS